MPAMQPRGWLLVAVFAPALVALAQVWARVDYQSRGFLVPVVALWAFYRERPRRARLEAAPDRLGLGVLGLALAIFLLGLATGLLTYVVACGLMLALGALLQRLERPG